MDPIKTLNFNSDRQWGVELEICSYDRRDFQRHPLNREQNEQPEGIENVACLLSEKLKFPVQVNKWHYTHNNSTWVLKPDRSCGIEICTPVYRGWHGLEKCCLAIQALASEPKVAADDRCGLHVHMGMNDLSVEQIGAVLAYWIKCESVFLDSVPKLRKRNRYCQQIGISGLFDTDSDLSALNLINRLSSPKYYTVNTYHMQTGKRRTIEWRIMEGQGCLDAYLVKNWIRLLVHFVEMTKDRPITHYSPNDNFSGLLWLDPMDVMDVLGFFGPLSKGLEETRNWFVARLFKNLSTDMTGIWSPPAREIAMKQTYEIIQKLGIEDKIAESLNPLDLNLALYNPESRI